MAPSDAENAEPVQEPRQEGEPRRHGDPLSRLIELPDDKKWTAAHVRLSPEMWKVIEALQVVYRRNGVPSLRRRTVASTVRWLLAFAIAGSPAVETAIKRREEQTGVEGDRCRLCNRMWIRCQGQCVTGESESDERGDERGDE